MPYFKATNYSVFDNANLRTPQVHGYFQLLNHFENDEKDQHAIVILPTGLGKTVLMAMAPFGIANDKVLIIAPQLTIRDTIVDALDPGNPSNVYRKYNILKTGVPHPQIYSFDSSRSPRAQFDLVEKANIIVLNAQKLQGRLDSSPLNFLACDYFDMIIIDESHHSAAETWTNTLDHFSTAKVVKVTATNFRTDGVDIQGKVVYKYSLAEAMHDNYVKSLEQCKYIPDELFLTSDEYPGEQFTVEQIFAMGLGDADWVSRSVAYSYDCNKAVALKSLDALKELRLKSDVPHKILAVTCSIKHAIDVAAVYSELGARSAVVHSDMPESEKSLVFKAIENDRLDVIVNVNMLGEGYDHKYLTIGAIFRPFKNMLPYLQFVGRLLRRIPDSECKSKEDNIAKLITHHHLGLDELWSFFREVAHDAEIIKGITTELPPSVGGGETEGIPKVSDIGDATDSLGGIIETDSFLNTQLIIDRTRENEEREVLISKLAEMLGQTKEQAARIIDNNQNLTEDKRLDLMFTESKKGLDNRIRYQLVPQTFKELPLDPKGFEFLESDVFDGPYSYLKKRSPTNDVLLAQFFNRYLQVEIGLDRKDWTLKEYDIAAKKLELKYELVFEQLKSHFDKS